MRFKALLAIPFLSWGLSSCSAPSARPAPTKPQAPAPAIAPAPPPSAAISPVVPAPPSRPAQAPRVVSREISGITFEGVAFDSSSHRLAVVDQPGGPGSRYADARSAGIAVNGLAAINAGFFTPEGAPLGKLITSGKPVGSWNRASSLGSGVFLESTSGNLVIARREAVSATAPQRELLQAGPLLIENGRPVSGLDPQKSAVRVLMIWTGGSQWWIGRTSSCTLAELASALGQGSPTGGSIRHALNLDGGRSADLWVSNAVSGGPLTRRPAWNRPVRNFLVLISR